MNDQAIIKEVRKLVEVSSTLRDLVTKGSVSSHKAAESLSRRTKNLLDALLADGTKRPMSGIQKHKEFNIGDQVEGISACEIEMTVTSLPVFLGGTWHYRIHTRPSNTAGMVARSTSKILNGAYVNSDLLFRADLFKREDDEYGVTD